MNSDISSGLGNGENREKSEVRLPKKTKSLVFAISLFVSSVVSGNVQAENKTTGFPHLDIPAEYLVGDQFNIINRTTDILNIGGECVNTNITQEKLNSLYELYTSGGLNIGLKLGEAYREFLLDLYIERFKKGVYASDGNELFDMANKIQKLSNGKITVIYVGDILKSANFDYKVFVIGTLKNGNTLEIKGVTKDQNKVKQKTDIANRDIFYIDFGDIAVAQIGDLTPLYKGDKAKLSFLNAERIELSDELINAKADLAAAKNNISGLYAKIEALEEKIEQQEDQNEKDKANASRIALAALNKALKLEKTQANELADDVKVATDEEEKRLNKIIEEKKEEIKGLKEQAEKASLAAESFRKKKLLEQASEYNKQIIRIKQELADAYVQLNRTATQLKNISAAFESYRATKNAENLEVRDGLSRANSSILDLKVVIKSLKTRIGRLGGQLTAGRDKYNRLNLQYKRQVLNNKSIAEASGTLLNSSTSRAESDSARIEELEEELKKINLQNNELREAIELFKKQLEGMAALIEKVKDFEEKGKLITSLKAQLDEMSKANKLLEEEKGELSTQVNSAADYKKDLENMSDVQKEVIRLQEELDNAIESIEALQLEKDNLTLDLKSAQESLDSANDLNKQLDMLNGQNAIQIKNLTDRIEGLAASVRAEVIRGYNKRTKKNEQEKQKAEKELKTSNIEKEELRKEIERLKRTHKLDLERKDNERKKALEEQRNRMVEELGLDEE